jgi:hypothetical protein
MKTRPVPFTMWRKFLDRYSVSHQNWKVRLEVLDRTVGPETEVREGILEGLALDPAVGGNENLSVMIGAKADAHLCHIVKDPLSIMVTRSADGATEVMSIESRQGSKTLLHLASPS